MSSKNQYSKRGQSAMHGSPIGEFSIDLNVSDLENVSSVTIHDDFSLFAQLVSCQIISSGLDGVDATVSLSQSNDGVQFDEIPNTTSTLSSSPGSALLEKSNFSGKFLGANISLGSVTSGEIKLLFVVKHH
jgi:hypothetical protein